MNMFGAITIIITVVGALAGAILTDLVILRNRVIPYRWLLVALAGLISGYLTLKLYRWLLRKSNERADRK